MPTLAISARRLERALHAGQAAYAVAVLLTALLAAPLVATVDFAHSHPEGVTAHVHPLTQLLPSDGAQASDGTLPGWILLLTLALAAAGMLPRCRPDRANRSRAPPIV